MTPKDMEKAAQEVAEAAQEVKEATLRWKVVEDEAREASRRELIARNYLIEKQKAFDAKVAEMRSTRVGDWGRPVGESICVAE